MKTVGVFLRRKSNGLIDVEQGKRTELDGVDGVEVETV